MKELELPHERREFPRQSLTLAVQVKPFSLSAGPARIARGRTRDVNNVGAYFWAGGAFSIGQPLKLSLAVPAAEGCECRVEIHCEVVVTRIDTPSPGNGNPGVAVRILRFRAPSVFRGRVD